MSILEKYESYLSNLQWHLDTNNPKDAECIQQRIYDYKEVINDLKAFIETIGLPKKVDACRAFPTFIASVEKTYRITDDKWKLKKVYKELSPETTVGEITDWVYLVEGDLSAIEISPIEK